MVSGHGVCSTIIACTVQQHSVHRRINQLQDAALAFLNYPVCSRAGSGHRGSVLLLLPAYEIIFVIDFGLMGGATQILFCGRGWF
ncbi:hypothetical protein Zmor_001040 [Zophobas morio]|uniref:Uncharacterized protein n=1 Tax=Zophobas morio TaxID=2755281 RepID=A0AA38J7N9_9CUCU|nr:hypothetical protein Zmor_001040 [Zophobas morio]